MPSAAPRSESTTSTPRALRPGAADAVPITASPMTVVVPAARAPRSRFRRDVARAAYSSQQSFSSMVIESPQEELGGVEDGREQGRDSPRGDRMDPGDLLVAVVADGAAAGLHEHR